MEINSDSTNKVYEVEKIIKFFIQRWLNKVWLMNSNCLEIIITQK